MKYLKLTLFSLIALFISGSIFVSCSNDNETTFDEPTNKNVDSFLKSFYSEDYSFGLSTKIKSNSQISALSRTASLEEVELTEVFVGNEDKARGYIITDKENGEFLFFIDVNRNTFTLTTLDVKNTEQKTFNNINEIHNYFSTDEFDFIEIALDESSNTNEAGKKFWGSSYSQGPCDPNTGLAQLFDDYHVMGIRVKHQASVGVDGGSIYEPCGMH